VLRNLSDRLERVSSGWVVLIALVIFVLFAALVLPRQASSAESSTRGADSPDMSFFYSPRDLYGMAEAYGTQGRADYVRARFTFDLIWPLVYTFFLATAISWINRGDPVEGRHLLNLAPVFGAVCDYLENISTSLVMLRYPQPTLIVEWLAPLFTFLKWILVYGSFLILVMGAAAAAVRWLKGRSRRP